VEGNWRWRCIDETLTASVLDRLRDLTISSSRAAPLGPQKSPKLD
jgi:hypothetical protein